MNGYIVYNGFMGFGAVHVFVVAPDAETARTLAEARFKAEAQSGRGPRYPEKFWTQLEVQQVTTGAGASEVID